MARNIKNIIENMCENLPINLPRLPTPSGITLCFLAAMNLSDKSKREEKKNIITIKDMKTPLSSIHPRIL